jgi:hypothetical protein
VSAEVQGYCPWCGSKSLFLGSGGYITCSVGDCTNPSAASDILGDRETEHVVVLGEVNFTIRHPLRERLDDALLSCDLHSTLQDSDGPPKRPGTYRVRDVAGRWVWTRKAES